MLSDLPLPPLGKQGWPWTEQSAPLPPRTQTGGQWPRISIVTPSYNQGRYIEETIRSVLLQNYPNLEYIIIDGGSTDTTLEIIRRYSPWLKCWVSEVDRGQSHAINKGLSRRTGQIICWLCSDDILLEGSLRHVATELSCNQPQWLVGTASVYDERTRKRTVRPPLVQFDLENFFFWSSLSIAQPSVFWTRPLQEKVGLLNESLDYCMDLDLWFRFWLQTNPLLSNICFSQQRYHATAKTSGHNNHFDLFMAELAKWMIVNLFQSERDDIKKYAVSAVSTLQRRNKFFERMKQHSILGLGMRFWKRFFNSQFPL